jgi:esterase/lipase
MKEKTLYVPPKASAMTETLRGMGYSTSSALADIIDNSITAQATEIFINFKWEYSDSIITILDNGNGMDDIGLLRAMRLGELNPLEERMQSDLGRFGVGLKTASFSQCRVLTVSSKKNKNINTLRWDLDFLSKNKDDGWYLLEGFTEKAEKNIELLSNLESGTLVIWEKLDRIIRPGYSSQNFLDLIDSVDKYLSMVFHRFIGGNHPRLKIFINEKKLSSWDPFLTSNPATWASPIDTIRTHYGTIKVQGYVLPTHEFLSENEYKSAGGLEGWNAQQGFYVYRNDRLIVPGSWLGLGTSHSWAKEESHKLARINLDIPNTADIEWGIDIRKSKARIPAAVESRLLLFAEDIRRRSYQVFLRRRGGNKIVKEEELVSVWNPVLKRNRTTYVINRKHPVIAELVHTNKEEISLIEKTLQLIEKAVPIQKIWSESSDSDENEINETQDDDIEEIQIFMDIIYQNLLNNGYSPDQAVKRLHSIEPFNRHPDMLDKLLDEDNKGAT